jgi:cation diffusion facilitator CzcD-associated flavoprotein CzcO
VDKHKLGEYIRLNSRIVDAKWDGDKGIWEVQVENVLSGAIVNDWCDFLLNAGGLLNQWKWPDIPGLQSFGGTLVHSANWPDNLNLSDKKVAVIGNGSSGLQIIPAIQPQVKELVHPIRTPTWVTAGADSRYRTLREKKISNTFSEEQKRDFRSNPQEYMDFIKQVEREGNAKFRMMVNGSEGAKKAERDIRQSMLDALGARAKDLGPKIVPNFAVGCRRITPGVGYLESFSEPNVQVFVGAGVEGVDETGISLTTGEHIEVDVMICSTGFDVTFNPRFPIVGRNGVDLADRWRSPNIPRAYLSLAIPEFPNYFGK